MIKCHFNYDEGNRWNGQHVIITHIISSNQRPVGWQSSFRFAPVILTTEPVRIITFHDLINIVTHSLLPPYLSSRIRSLCILCPFYVPFRPNRLCPVINGITTHLIVTGGPHQRISFPQHLLGFAPILAGHIIMGCHDDCLDDGQGIDYFCGLRFTGETTSKRITFIHIPLHAFNTHKHSHHIISISSVLLRWKQIGPFARRHHHCFFACDNTELDANWNVFTFDMGHLSRCGDWRVR